MSSRSALSVVEQHYGSLEELAYHILESKQEALDETAPLARRADAVGLPMLVFARILADPMFRQLLRTDLVNRAYTLAEEEAHIKHMVKVATNEGRTVVTNKGNLVKVDQMPSDVINAGKYLNELRGTPVEGKRESAFKGVVVNFENVTITVGGDDAAESRTIEVDAHTPRRAGDLPPDAVPRRNPATVPLPAPDSPPVDSVLGDFYGESAREKDEADALARKVEGDSPGSPERPRTPVWPGTRRNYVTRNIKRYHRTYREREKPPYDD